jgi:dTDP-4-amino-4,6-dideoxygalactose transaminase
MSYEYNPWPVGQVPKELRRTEPEEIRLLGYEWNDPREIIDIFERKVAEFAGSKYAVAVDCCTHAMELSLEYLLLTREIDSCATITLPVNTYVSVPQMLMRLGFEVDLTHAEWRGIYWLMGSRVFDGAVCWRKGMYVGSNYTDKPALQCVSFQIKKRIPIGRGGMILTDDKEAAEWLKLASYDGRDLKTPYTDPDHVKFPGYHYYMTPEDAARGILLMDAIHEEGDTGCWQNYPNVKEMLKL